VLLASCRALLWEGFAGVGHSAGVTATNHGLLELGLNFCVTDPTLTPEESQEMLPFMTSYFQISKSIPYGFLPLQQVVSYGTSPMIGGLQYACKDGRSLGLQFITGIQVES